MDCCSRPPFSCCRRSFISYTSTVPAPERSSAATPLLLFAAAARRIPLTLVGLLFYVAPTLQFLLGVLVYHEPFTHAQAIGFGIVWVGLLCFSAESALVRRGLAATS